METSPVGSQTPSDSTAAFRTVISPTVEADPSFSFEDDTWSVSYHYDLCCVPENLRPHQLELAENFTAVQPDGVTVALRTTHECQYVEWAVPSAVARRFQNGELSATDLENHIANSTTRTESC